MKLLAVLVVSGIVFGDAATAATVASIGVLINTFMTARLSRRVDDAHRDLAAPRQILHDDEGRAVASVIARESDDPDNPGRRTADHMTRRKEDLP